MSHPPAPVPSGSRPDAPRLTRVEPREVVELKAIRDAHPELAPAVDMQLALVGLTHRIQSRVPSPTSTPETMHLQRCIAERRPLLVFDDIPLDWTDLRLMVRQTVDVLRRFGSLDDEAAVALQAMARTGDDFRRLVRQWYLATPSRTASGDPDTSPADATGMLDQVLTLAMRPFLARCAETLLSQIDLTAWDAPYCPLCGGEPELAAITPAAERLLLCGRCTGAWRFDSLACPFCSNRDRERITSFASRDGRYRLYGCDQCHRYLKAYDGRKSARSALLAVDTIATLPLDAAAIQKGYRG